MPEPRFRDDPLLALAVYGLIILIGIAFDALSNAVGPILN